MLFNSYEFVFGFLPLTLIIYFLLGYHQRHTGAKVWLIAASLFFYGWWNPVYLLLIVLSILVNYSLGIALANTRSKALLIVGVVLNLSLLGYYKYANFFVDTVNALTDSSFHLATIVLPLAISFFTFQQIAYLVDAYRREAEEHNFLSYSLFVTFFPQLIAGPIVHHKQMLPQFGQSRVYSLDERKFTVGLTIFFFGLFKKVVFADNIAGFGTPVFAAADAGAHISFFEAWGGALAYTFQLYFDFSGYSDMAIGLALLFGICLPINFSSPYKAQSIADFWRRWHQTLSAFLRDYLYIALGGNRHGKNRRYINLMITMLLGGLWHGAGWNFVIWGGLHGCYLVINQVWSSTCGKWFTDGAPYRFASISLTFFAVVIGWVFFRAETLSGAMAILQGMSGFNGAVLDVRLADTLSFLSPIVEFEGRHAGAFRLQGVAWIGGLAAVAFLAPNVAQIMNYDPTKWQQQHWQSQTPQRWQWRPSAVWATATTIVAATAILNMNKISEFLYFQF